MPCPFDVPGCHGTTCANCTKHPDIAQFADVNLKSARVEAQKILQASAFRARQGAPPLANAPGVHVNRGAMRGPEFLPSSPSLGVQNCALCATAGCYNLAVGYVALTSQTIAFFLGTQDSIKAYGELWEEQRDGIVRKLSGLLSRFKCTITGEEKTRLSLDDALTLMHRYPDGTVFVISCKGSIRGVRQTQGHWLNARKTAAGVEFIDFQTDSAHRQGRASVSARPLLGLYDAEFEGPMLVVIAFERPADGAFRPLPRLPGPYPDSPVVARGAAAAASVAVASASVVPPLIPPRTAAHVASVTPFLAARPSAAVPAANTLRMGARRNPTAHGPHLGVTEAQVIPLAPSPRRKPEETKK